MPKKKLFHTIFIACEGDNTEPNYLGRIAECIDEERRVKVTVFPKPKLIEPEGEDDEGIRRSDPIGLVEEARKKLGEGFDEVWAVFDKNGHTGHTEAFQKAEEEINGKKVNIAFSSIAFEYWILLHFEQSQTAFLKSKNLIEDRFLTTGAGLFPDYSKSRMTDIYTHLKYKTLTAIENAFWLRQMQKQALVNANGKVYEVNPYTDVDRLIKVLLAIPYNYTWANSGEDIQFMEFTVNISNANGGFSINLTNQTGTTLVLNAGNLSEFFFIHNSNFTLQIEQTVMIGHGDNAIFELTSIEALAPEARLVFQVKEERLVIG